MTDTERYLGGEGRGQNHIYTIEANSEKIQWNLSNLDTNGTEESVHISEVSFFKSHVRTVLGERKGLVGVLISV